MWGCPVVLRGSCHGRLLSNRLWRRIVLRAGLINTLDCLGLEGERGLVDTDLVKACL
jgi:hypothetical protein